MCRLCKTDNTDLRAVFDKFFGKLLPRQENWYQREDYIVSIVPRVGLDDSSVVRPIVSLGIDGPVTLGGRKAALKSRGDQTVGARLSGMSIL